MFNTIKQKLMDTEKENDIKILYAVESGSRGWGFASKDSDYDCRFIYIHQPDWYLSIDEKKDFIEYPVDEVFDVNGWDIRKALKLLRKSNPPLLEWFTSPIVYMENMQIVENMRSLGKDFFDPVHGIYHYLHIAKRHFEEISASPTAKLKKYFYILRPLFACKWIEQNRTMPPMEYALMVDNLSMPEQVTREIGMLMAVKLASDEKLLVEQNQKLISFFAGEIKYYCECIKKIPKNNQGNSDDLDCFFRQTLKDVWANEGNDKKEDRK